jgi:hypothetical protein
MAVDRVGLKKQICGPQPLWSLCHFFLGVNPSRPGMTSTSNHIA